MGTLVAVPVRATQRHMKSLEVHLWSTCTDAKVRVTSIAEPAIGASPNRELDRGDLSTNRAYYCVATGS